MQAINTRNKLSIECISISASSIVADITYLDNVLTDSLWQHDMETD